VNKHAQGSTLQHRIQMWVPLTETSDPVTEILRST